MPRECTVCTHSQRPEIDRALVEGATYRTIADRFELSESSLKRHRADHLPAHLAKANEVAEVADADDLLDQLKGLRSTAISILKQAERAGDFRTALMGIREARACVETLLEVEGELDRRPTVNLVLNPQWITLRASIVAALRPYPEAAIVVANVLDSGEKVST